jgi:purine-binding chemotaxis protein CheW
MSIDEANLEARLELISFEIAEQTFCIDIRAVREIRGWTPATPVPQAPAYVQGLINLRGAVMPVIDLRARLGLGETQPTSRHVIVVIDDGERDAGLLVDGVEETFQIDASVPQAPPELGTATTDRFVDAIIPTGDRLISRLVVGHLLPEPAMAA